MMTQFQCFQLFDRFIFALKKNKEIKQEIIVSFSWRNDFCALTSESKCSSASKSSCQALLSLTFLLG